MFRTAAEVQRAVFLAIELYKSTVLDPRFLNAETGLYKYPYRISEAEILRLAGIKSRSTLRASYHHDVRMRVENCVKDLKEKTGKAEVAPDKDAPEDRSVGGTERLEAMAQTIVALRLRVMALEQELAEQRGLRRNSASVTSLSTRRARSREKGV